MQRAGRWSSRAGRVGRTVLSGREDGPLGLVEWGGRSSRFSRDRSSFLPSTAWRASWTRAGFAGFDVLVRANGCARAVLSVIRADGSSREEDILRNVLCFRGEAQVSKEEEFVSLRKQLPALFNQRLLVVSPTFP